jgi:hypothetical protein
MKLSSAQVQRTLGAAASRVAAEPGDGVRPMRRGAAVAASVASGAAAWVALAESWGQPVPAYGRPGWQRET